MPYDSELVSTSAAARAVGVDRSTLWRWIKHGYIEPHSRTAGGHLRWNAARLQDEIYALRPATTTTPAVPNRTTAQSPEPAPVVAAVITPGLGVLVGRRTHPTTGRTMIYLACTPTAGTDLHIGDPDELADLRWVDSLDALFDLIPRDHIFEPVREHLSRLLT